MTLLDDIINGAAGDEPVAGLLRRLKIVAARTDAGRLAEWVGRELDGYPDAGELPDYRGPFSVQALGHFMGFAGRELTNFAIPPMTLPKELRDTGLFHIHVLQPVAEVEVLAEAETTTYVWPADAVRSYNGLVSTGKINRIVEHDLVLAAVKRPVPRTVFVGVLDAVRNRALDLALELEQHAPAAGSQVAATEETKAEVAQVVNNFNLYGPSNLAIGSSHTRQTVQLPNPGDADALVRYLAAAGVPLDRLHALERAIAEDLVDDERDGEPGRWQRAKAWFASASTDLATSTAGGVLGAAATAFLGLH